MTVTLEDVKHVAALANLELTETEMGSMQRDLNSVLSYFGELNQLDTSNVPPTLQVQVSDSRQEDAATNLRPDEVAPSLDRQSVMTAAPDTDGIYFRVPKVIER